MPARAIERRADLAELQDERSSCERMIARASPGSRALAVDAIGRRSRFYDAHFSASTGDRLPDDAERMRKAFSSQGCSFVLVAFR